MTTKKCLICKRPNDTLHWHRDPEGGDQWVWCNGTCQRGYSLWEYCFQSGVNLSDFLKLDFAFKETTPNEVNVLDWPNYYIPMSDPRAEKGVEYVKSRGLDVRGDMYYDTDRESIVFPYYFQSSFVGAQTRLLQPWERDGETVKILTMPGTRLGLVFYNWNQSPFVTDIKGVIVCEGAFNTLAIQQSLDKLYGGVVKNPWKVIATSGCGTTNHQLSKIKELKDAGIKIVSAFDSDEPGMKGLEKMVKKEALTHYALTEDTEKDWNDVLKDVGHSEFAKIFLDKIKKV